MLRPKVGSRDGEYSVFAFIRVSLLLLSAYSNAKACVMLNEIGDSSGSKRN